MIKVNSFAGEIPHVTPRGLPENAAQSAVNCRMVTGDLTPWRQFALNFTLAAFAPPAAVKTIYLLDGVWLSFKEQVDIAPGLVEGDTNFLTFLTSPALYAVPQYTTKALATSGAAPYPFATRPLGIPNPDSTPTVVAGVDPTPTTFSVDITDVGDELASWTRSVPSGGSNYSDVVQNGVTGYPLPSYQLLADENIGRPAFIYRNFGIGTAAIAAMTFSFSFASPSANHQQVTAHIMNGAAAVDGIQVLYDSSLLALQIRIAGGWTALTSVLATTPLAGLAYGTEYQMDITVVANEDLSQTVTATVRNGVTVLATISTTNTFVLGGYCGFVHETSADDVLGQYSTFIDNVHVTASGSNGFVAQNISTAYVFTHVNDNVGGTGFIWESGPSLPSATIARPDGVQVTVTTPTTVLPVSDPLYGITKKYIYRLVVGNTGTLYYKVGEVPLGTADFVDTLDDEAITNPGVPLPSEGWELPPADMQGIRALPNNCMVGFSKNFICFSEQGRPHAWPVKYRLPVDSNVVMINNIDTTIVIGTKSFAYTAAGNKPGGYSMSQPGEKQSCSSKRGMTYVDGFGVAYPSPDGIMVCNGSAAKLRNATETLFTKEQWEALDPTSMISVVYDGILFFWFAGTTPDRGYALDTKPGGFGLISLSHHITAVYTDPLTDKLYVVLDVNSEPTLGSLPLASTAVAAGQLLIYEFNSSAGSGNMVAQWRGRLNLMPHPTTLHFARVRTLDFTNTVARFYANGALLKTQVISSARHDFRLPGLRAFESYEMEVLTTNTVRGIQAARTVEELD